MSFGGTSYINSVLVTLKSEVRQVFISQLLWTAYGEPAMWSHLNSVLVQLLPRYMSSRTCDPVVLMSGDWSEPTTCASKHRKHDSPVLDHHVHASCTFG